MKSKNKKDQFNRKIEYILKLLLEIGLLLHTRRIGIKLSSSDNCPFWTHCFTTNSTNVMAEESKKELSSLLR